MKVTKVKSGDGQVLVEPDRRIGQNNLINNYY
jgi:hypothetical protein